MSEATLGRPFVATHPFGEQAWMPSWPGPMHANLMFGGVLFGKATFGANRRAELFLSYQWGDNQRTQAIVSANHSTSALSLISA